PGRAEAARAEREHERPDRREDRAVDGGLREYPRVLHAALDARHHVHRHLVQMLGEVGGRVEDARELLRAKVFGWQLRPHRTPGARVEAEGALVERGDTRALLRV